MDSQTFTTIDAMLFTRLHWGPLTPIIFLLKNGQRHQGQVVAVARAGATGQLRNALRGEVSLATDQGPLLIQYEEIASIE